MKKLRKIHPKYLAVAVLAGFITGYIFSTMKIPPATTDTEPTKPAMYKNEDRHKLEKLMHQGAQHND